MSGFNLDAWMKDNYHSPDIKDAVKERVCCALGLSKNNCPEILEEPLNPLAFAYMPSSRPLNPIEMGDRRVMNKLAGDICRYQMEREAQGNHEQPGK